MILTFQSMLNFIMTGFQHTLIIYVWLLPVLCKVSAYTPPYKPWDSVPTHAPVEPLPEIPVEPDDTDEGGTGAEPGAGAGAEAGEITAMEPTSPAPDEDKGAGHIIGASVGIAVILAIAIALAVYMWRRRRKRYANTYCVAAQEEQLVKKIEMRENGLGSSPSGHKKQKVTGNGAHQEYEDPGTNGETLPIVAFSVSESLEDRDRSMGESCTPKSPLAPASLDQTSEQPLSSPKKDGITSPTTSEGGPPGPSPALLGRREVWTESQVLLMMDEEEVLMAKDQETTKKGDDGKSVQSEDVFVDAPSPGSSVELVSSEPPSGDPTQGDPFGSTDTFRSAISHFDKRRSWMSSGEVVFEETL